MTSDSNFDISRNPIFDGKYEILGAVGRGKSSVVYKARMLESRDFAAKPTNTIVALKVLTGSAKDPSLNVKRMERESLSMLACRHPNVVRCIDYMKTGDLCYITMEYAERGDLFDLLSEQQQPLAPSLVFDLTSQLLAGLDRIHRSGLIHRDIKPENLLLSAKNELKIADFSIAVLPAEFETPEEMSTGVGTLDYIAPECLEGGMTTVSADLYAVGITMYYMLTRDLPYGADTFAEQLKKKINGERVPIARHLHEAPPFIEELLDKVLAVDVAKRFQSAAEFADALEKFKHGEWTPEIAEETSDLMHEDTSPLINEHDDRGYADRFLSTDDPVSGLGAYEELEPFEDSPTEYADESSSLPDDYPMHAPPSLFQRVISFLSNIIGRVGIKRALIFSFLFGLAIAIFVFSRGDTSKVSNKTQILPSSIKPAVSENSKLAEFLLQSESRGGSLTGLFEDEKRVSIFASLIPGTKEVVFTLGVPGWRPSIVRTEELLDDKELVLASGGLKISLWSEQSLSNKKISGRYKEHVSGREGNWELQ